MKKAYLVSALLLTTIFMAGAQDITVDEILDNYFENTGGVDNWKALEGIKMSTKLNQGGMEIPLEIVRMKDGRTYTKLSLQGTDIFQGVFDGETLWNMNFQTMKAEKADQETTDNFKLELNDFPDSFIDYQDKGYTAELVGTEPIDGTDCYKIKLVKEPVMVNGEEKESVSFYYFDTESFVPLAFDSEVLQGPQAGVIQRITQSDYDEVEGLYFPFSMTQGIKDGPSQPITMETIEINPTVDDSVFKFPGE